MRNDIPWLKLNLNEDGVPERTTGINFGNIDDISNRYAAFDPDPFYKALELLSSTWAEEYYDFQEMVQIIIPSNAPEGWRVDGYSVSSYQGACWIVSRKIEKILETLVHEQSHLKLRYIEDTIPILASDQPTEVFPVGWRTDSRPIEGIFEGVFVHIHCILAMSKIISDHTFKDYYFDERLHQLEKQVAEGVNILGNHANFTEYGRIFLDWAQNVIHRA